MGDHTKEIPKILNETTTTTQGNNETYCGDCYGGTSESGCCNTCEEVREAYIKKGWSFNAPDKVAQVCSFN